MKFRNKVPEELLRQVEAYLREHWVEETVGAPAAESHHKGLFSLRRAKGVESARKSFSDAAPAYKEAAEERAYGMAAESLKNPTDYVAEEPAKYLTLSIAEESADYVAPPDLERLRAALDKTEDTFQQTLFKLIDRSGMEEPEVYDAADVDRRHFSKIRSNPGYQPKKQTVMAFSLALRLNLDETLDLLKKAGFSLSPSSRQDLIFEFCIQNQIYPLAEVNDILFQFDQPLLGGRLVGE